MNWDLGIFKKSKFLVAQFGRGTSKEKTGLKNASQSPCNPRHDANYGKNTLLEILHTEIIPTLAAAKTRSSTFLSGSEMSEYALSTNVIHEFALLCVNPDASKAETFVQNLLDTGHSTESIYLQLFSPSARYLGTLWEEDECDFVQVTLGLMQLQMMTRKIGNSFHDRYNLSAPGPKVLFAPMPGSQHTLGVLIVSELFRKEGWQVWMELGSSEKNLLSTLSEEWFDVVGLSIGTEAQLDELSTLIDRVRRASHNPSVLVMIGGPAIHGRSDHSHRFGADAFAADAASAVKIARELLATTVLNKIS